MPFTITMPKLSPTMEEGTITKWCKKEGDLVRSGEVLIEVATDKATVEHSALDGGYLRKILIREGEMAIVNQPIAIFTEKKEESIAGYQPEGEMPQPKVTAAPTTEKPLAEAPSSAAPRGAGLQQPAFVPEPPLEQLSFKAASRDITERIPASPLARRLARERGIDLSTVTGSGPHGRIMERDLDLGQPATAVAFGRREAPTHFSGSYEEIPLTPMRKVIGQRLQESKTFIPHFYETQEIHADRLVQLRQELSQWGLKLTYNDFVVRACALALREHPVVNSGFNSVNQAVIRFKTIDIAIAVSLEAGLITPIIRYTDFKNLGQISTEIRSLVARARASKLEREEYMGGSFTISNIGMFGITEFKAILNPPQAAILAVGGILDQPIVKEGCVVPGKVMKVTLSADHRVLDGTDVAKFLKTLQKYLENPSVLLV